MGKNEIKKPDIVGDSRILVIISYFFKLPKKLMTGVGKISSQRATSFHVRYQCELIDASFKALLTLL